MTQSSMTPNFAHLNIHTEYSISDGILRIDEMFAECVKLNMPAIAITDQNNFFGLVKFYQAALKSGIKPIIGIDVLIFDTALKTPPTKLILLAQNEIGYKKLLRLISTAYLKNQIQDKPIIEKIWLEEEGTTGIIALSGGLNGDIGQALKIDDLKKANAHIEYWQKLFPERFYIELQRTNRPDEEKYIRAILPLANEYNLPVVATNDVRFLQHDDFDAHEARVCIHDGSKLIDAHRSRPYSEEQYLRSPTEMAELFRDIPSALENTIEIAKRCNVILNIGKNFLPIFKVPEAQNSVEEYFAAQSRLGLENRLIQNFSSETETQNTMGMYQQRLEHEITVINQMGFASYFLIVADFIRWARKNDIPVGPGRGSGAGSLVAYALKITDVDPIVHELLFERFLNPERVSLPDFDIDFCMDGRDRVIEYVINRYGADSASQIVTHGTMAAKAVVRDVGRVLSLPYGLVDKIAKLIPFTLGITLEEALKEKTLQKIYQNDVEIKNLINLALKLEGIVRNVGKHAAGVVIAPTKLTDFTPLYCEPNKLLDEPRHILTQFDKDDVEAIGLVKFDFLGLRNLTIIESAVKNINSQRALKNELPLDITQLPLDDKKTFQLIKACATTAVFQIESRGMKDLIKRLQPDAFSDIVALVALYRPGPLQSGMVDDFINRKHGKAKVSYPHPLLEQVLKPTYGVILYQEQVMQIAQLLAGYTLGSADILRRAMGKKKPEEMAKQRAIFTAGATKQNIDKHTANNIFDLMENFAAYGFNKSHSVAYALISYQTAWLKSHYPAEFMAAVLSADMDNTDKIVKLIFECKVMGLTVVAPKINLSVYAFTIDASQQIIFGLGAIKGLGAAAIQNIMEERQKNGNFKNLFDLCDRIDRRKINRKSLEALIKSGTLDAIGPNRATTHSSINKALQLAEQQAKIKQSAQLSLFDTLDFDEEPGAAPINTNTVKHSQLYEIVSEWPTSQLLSAEKSVLGFYLSGHPLEQFLLELQKFIPYSLTEIAEHPQNKSLLIAGFVSATKVITTKNNRRMAVINLEDLSGNIEVVIFSDLYTESAELLATEQLLIVEGETSIDDYSGNMRIRAKSIMNLDAAREKYAKSLCLKLEQNQINSEFIVQLAETIKPFSGGKFPVYIDYHQPTANAKLLLNKDWGVQLKSELIENLEALLDKENVNIEYE